MRTVTIRNLTPHSLDVRLPGGTSRKIESTGVARVIEIPGTPIDPGEYPDGIPIWTSPSRPKGYAIEGLPDPTDGVIFVVSALVAARIRELYVAGCTDRRDIYYPGTGPHDGAVRNNDGQIVAVTRLIWLT